MREFRIQSGAVSSQKDADEFGEAFVPEYVYEVIRKLDRFSSMTVSSILFQFRPIS
jgi:hypothetical protein